MQLSKGNRKKFLDNSRCRILSSFKRNNENCAPCIFRGELGDKHAQKLIAALLTQLKWPAADVREVLDEDAISDSQMHRIHKAVRDEDLHGVS